jgi:hypothetical protein
VTNINTSNKVQTNSNQGHNYQALSTCGEAFKEESADDGDYSLTTTSFNNYL